jgi:hypothetical protein
VKLYASHPGASEHGVQRERVNQVNASLFHTETLRIL